MKFEDDFDTLYRNCTRSSVEIRANDFAMRFLMPAKFMAIEARKIVESPDFEEISLEDFIKRMADRFQVPFEKMKQRLKDLRYLDREA
ncbi:hypothetical protein BKH46_08365 [Helicobacter sp. 12S02634-8]|uniref:ImmA/IrrE family metallo-endopeptidase n=1 Tax=Helicobacter sp. 12S02634-8 TaxID=1476199 RepID=UPI000BA7B185|nr:hypothetical protein [Helicobacter sp. 12S02634-8]PAF46244.1 hypothetical protein BKH46_08365 [Helicobacter sp. 12S02634-8]